MRQISFISTIDFHHGNIQGTMELYNTDFLNLTLKFVFYFSNNEM